jgi:hypothetical protein
MRTVVAQNELASLWVRGAQPHARRLMLRIWYYLLRYHLRIWRQRKARQ